MTLTINEKNISFSPDTLKAIGDKPLCNVLIHPKEKLLLLRPTSGYNRDLIDISRESIPGQPFIAKLRKVCGWRKNTTITCEGELLPEGVLFKLKDATVTKSPSILHNFRKKHPHQNKKTPSFSCWNNFMGRSISNEPGKAE